MSQGILRLGLTNQTYESFTVYIEFHVLFNHRGIYIGFEYDIYIIPSVKYSNE